MDKQHFWMKMEDILNNGNRAERRALMLLLNDINSGALRIDDFTVKQEWVERLWETYLLRASQLYYRGNAEDSGAKAQVPTTGI
ncbi:MAG TPA: hypothetical protein PKV71_04430 [Calditrichia bacterium]|nr:hypothetical protein [Calditrichota bacterium]HQU73063.1 hypothetical protein [Calditrichia bacterium]HQV31096.1 hypothetical protein [Calditrichia bacterium]